MLRHSRAFAPVPASQRNQTLKLITEALQLQPLLPPPQLIRMPIRPPQPQPLPLPLPLPLTLSPLPLRLPLRLPLPLQAYRGVRTSLDARSKK